MVWVVAAVCDRRHDRIFETIVNHPDTDTVICAETLFGARLYEPQQRLYSTDLGIFCDVYNAFFIRVNLCPSVVKIICRRSSADLEPPPNGSF